MTNLKILYLILIISSEIFCQNLDSLNFDKMDKTVCRIYIHQNIDKDEIINVGTGILVSAMTDSINIKYVFTAHHVIENLIKLKNSHIEIFLNDSDNNIWSTKELNEKVLLWSSDSMDAAIIGIPKLLYHKPFPEGYELPGFEILKKIETGIIGEEVYMLGKRWLYKNYSISILKKGIVSSITKEFPDFKDQYIYLIDKMSNKGMSGGLIYNKSGEGIAMISGYILENDKKVRTSDDLTIGIPLSVMFNQLNEMIEEKSSQIKIDLGYQE